MQEFTEIKVTWKLSQSDLSINHGQPEGTSSQPNQEISLLDRLWTVPHDCQILVRWNTQKTYRYRQDQVRLEF